MDHGSARRARLPLVIAAAAIGLGLADSLRTIHIQPIITIVVFAVAAGGLFNSLIRPTVVHDRFYEPRDAAATTPPVALTLFVVWAAGTLVLHPLTTEGIQNLLVLVSFLFAIPATAGATTAGTPPRIFHAFRNAGVALSVAYLVLVVRFGPGVDYIVSARAVGGSLLACLTVTIASRAVLKTPRWPMLLMVLTIGLSLSRTATAIALILLMTLAIRGARSMTPFRVIAWGTVLLGTVAFAFQHFAAFRNRFTQGDNYHLGGVTLNTSGRSVLWSAVYHHWLEHRWVGFGPGNAEVFTRSQFRTIDHPHNDYLRLLNDYGIIGTALFVVGVLALLVGARRRYKASEGTDQAMHLAAILTTVSLLLFMVANNPLVAIFGMVAHGAINGASIARTPTAETQEDAPLAIASETE